MSDLIYKRYRSHEWTTTWEQLSQAEKEVWLAKLDSVLENAGGMRFVLVACDSANALREWDTLGVEVFPDQVALAQYHQNLEVLNLAKYVDVKANIGADLGPLGLMSVWRPLHQ